jgi:MFS family permease
VRYRSVLGNREFAAILFSQALSTAGDQLARIAVALVVFDRTGSGLAASTTYAVSYLTYLAGGPFLSALSDRYPRLTVMVVCDLLRAPIVLLMCVEHPPTWLLFMSLILLGLLAPPFDSARSALQPEILPGEAYIAGNAIMNIVLQLGQVLGFVLGGALVATVSARGALVLDAATFLLSAGALTALVRRRAAAQAVEDRSSLFRDTVSGFRLVRDSRDLKRYLAYSVIGSAALITPEGLAVPVAHELGAGAFAAGVLTAAVSAGFVIASLLIVRLPAERRIGLLFPLSLLAITPLLFTPLVTDVTLVGVLWTVAGLGACLNLVASAAYVQACPAEYRARAYGVAVTLLFSVQGAALVLSGALADILTPAGAIAVTAALMLVALLAMPALRPGPAGAAQEKTDLVRGTTG